MGAKSQSQQLSGTHLTKLKETKRQLSTRRAQGFIRSSALKKIGSTKRLFFFFSENTREEGDLFDTLNPSLESVCGVLMCGATQFLNWSVFEG